MDGKQNQTFFHRQKEIVVWSEWLLDIDDIRQACLNLEFRLVLWLVN